MCFDFFLLKTIKPNLLTFLFYSLKQWRFSSVNQDNMAIESCVIGHMTYSYNKIYIKTSWQYATYKRLQDLVNTASTNCCKEHIVYRRYSNDILICSSQFISRICMYSDCVVASVNIPGGFGE